MLALSRYKMGVSPTLNFSLYIPLYFKFWSLYKKKKRDVTYFNQWSIKWIKWNTISIEEFYSEKFHTIK